MKLLSKSIRNIARRCGYSLVRCQSENGYPVDFDEREVHVIRATRPYTKTTAERMYSLIQAVRYVVANDVPGDLVECGVWRGGSMMIVAQTLIDLHCTDRHLYLYDTFEGMVRPTGDDVSYKGVRALDKFEKRQTGEDRSDWCLASLEEVTALMHGTGYDAEKTHLVPGKVEETLPGQAPEQISLLRLDTDWYESTRHELVHLFPRLAPGGVLVIDDYGDWLGARKAVDEYIAENNVSILLNRVDDSGRIGVKAA